MTMDCIKKYIDRYFTEERKRHTYGVAETAKILAKQYGADEQKSEIAALFHDMYRGMALETLNCFVKDFNLGSQYQNNANLAHAKIAAYVMERDYNIEDEDIVNAVKFHTTGRAGMSILEKIIFLADAIEPGRTYLGVEQIRQTALENLDEACLMVLEKTIEYVGKKGLYLDQDTVLARDYLKGKRRE